MRIVLSIIAAVIFFSIIGFAQQPQGDCEVYITSIPAGADIIVDGVPTNQITPAQIKGLVPGAHIISLEKDEYFGEKKVILQEGVVSRHEITLSLKPVKLRVHSDPYPAKVIIDNREIGHTPITATLENTGRFRLRIIRENYIPCDTILNLTERREYDFSAKLEESSFLTIKSHPSGADVFLDRVYIGSSPIDTALTYGVHSLQLMKGDYHLYQRMLELAPGERLIIEAQLEKLQGWLTVRDAPANTEIYLDGRLFALTPIEKRRVEVGEYDLTFHHREYEDQQESQLVVIAQDRETEIELDMRRKTLLRTIRRSLVFPGWGQQYIEQKTRGYFYTVGEVLLLAGVGVSTMLFNQAVNDYNEARNDYLKQIEPNNIAAARQRMIDRYDLVDKYDKQTRNLTYIAGGFWILNIVDIFIFKNRQPGFVNIKGDATDGIIRLRCQINFGR